MSSRLHCRVHYVPTAQCHQLVGWTLAAPVADRSARCCIRAGAGVFAGITRFAHAFCSHSRGAGARLVGRAIHNMSLGTHCRTQLQRKAPAVASTQVPPSLHGSHGWPTPCPCVHMRLGVKWRNGPRLTWPLAPPSALDPPSPPPATQWMLPVIRSCVIGGQWFGVVETAVRLNANVTKLAGPRIDLSPMKSMGDP